MKKEESVMCLLTTGRAPFHPMRRYLNPCRTIDFNHFVEALDNV